MHTHYIHKCVDSIHTLSPLHTHTVHRTHMSSHPHPHVLAHFIHTCTHTHTHVYTYMQSSFLHTCGLALVSVHRPCSVIPQLCSHGLTTRMLTSWQVFPRLSQGLCSLAGSGLPPWLCLQGHLQRGLSLLGRHPGETGPRCFWSTGSWRISPPVIRLSVTTLKGPCA